MKQTQQHFLVLAFPVQSHMNPTLQFSKRLIGMGARVTLLITVSMHRRIIQKPIIDGLTISTYSDGYDDGFNDPSNDINLYLSELKRLGKQALTNLMASRSNQGQPFAGVIYSLYLHWAAEVARSLHVPSAFLWIQPATVLDIFYYYLRGYTDYIDGKSQDPESEIELPGLPLMKTKELPSFLQPSNVYSFALPAMDDHFHELSQEVKPIVLVNTFEALESEAIRAVGKLNMIPIGPLVPSAFLDGKDPNDKSFGGDIFCSSSGYMEWLNSQPERSVLYVSFGSLSSLSERQTKEIAHALVDSGRPFLWVIRDFEVKRENEKNCEGKEKKEEEGVNCRGNGKKEQKENPKEKETLDETVKEEEENQNGEKKEEEGVYCRENGKKEHNKANPGEKETQDDTVEEEEKNQKKNGEEEREGWRKGLEEKGKIVNWCSQVEVLSHRAVGCFVTHCGWNSTIEALVSGIPMVAFPQWSDQATNAKLTEDMWKTGRRVRVNEEGLAESEEIRRCLDVVLGNGETAVEMRNNAEKWKELARVAVKEGGSSHQNLRAFMNDLDC
ncbi:hypothetical protein QN277_000041 [Acacia crassicarpa]|uniref:Glycosyltransferase n=1 Tax=Acacia crassicarpa TaxID=499986 RepID=A0AAE1TGQ0_9FABA|nr:hypothetical protein QN277_000041 [Acacia crassicarpa]